MRGRPTQEELERELRRTIRDIPDFPRPGILFRDITPMLASPALFREAVEALAAPFRDLAVSHVVGIESRGFILGAPVALAMDASFVPVRKQGKLPFRTRREQYALEYGSDVVEIHEDACAPGDAVLIVDDVLATGGTAEATARLVEGLGASVVGCSFLLELEGLGGRAKLAPRAVRSLLRY